MDEMKGDVMTSNERIVGIRHRRKMTKGGAARPTQIAVFKGSKVKTYDIPDDTAELDWVKGEFPRKYRAVTPDEDLGKFKIHQIKGKKLKKKDLSAYSRNLVYQDRDGMKLAQKVPVEFDGLQAGDTVLMVMGGSGDRLAYAIARRSESLGASLWRIPPKTLKDHRELDKEKDAETLTGLFQANLHFFYEVGPRDLQLIALIQAYRARIDAMKSRIAAEQRLQQWANGQVFLSPDGFFPEGSVEAFYDDQKANDGILQSLLKEEKARERELIKAVESFAVYEQVFKPITGVGPMIAARLLVAIGDIRRFPTESKLKAFIGAHVMPDGRFPRRRHGTTANWHADARQALWLIGDQFNRRPDSYWGKKLLQHKAGYRERHPKPVVDFSNGRLVKKYTPAHIHKLGTWRTITRFVEYVWREWTRFETESTSCV